MRIVHIQSDSHQKCWGSWKGFPCFPLVSNICTLKKPSHRGWKISFRRLLLNNLLACNYLPLKKNMIEVLVPCTYFTTFSCNLVEVSVLCLSFTKISSRRGTCWGFLFRASASSHFSQEEHGKSSGSVLMLHYIFLKRNTVEVLLWAQASLHSSLEEHGGGSCSVTMLQRNMIEILEGTPVPWVARCVEV